MRSSEVERRTSGEKETGSGTVSMYSPRAALLGGMAEGRRVNHVIYKKACGQVNL